MGTLVVIPLLLALISWKIPLFLLIPIFLLLTFGSIIVARSCEKRLKVHDPGWIVIDEVLGMLCTAFFIFIPHWPLLVAAFLLFRLFDILKPFPVGWIDREMKGGLGTILDDIMAGLMAGFVLLAGQFLFLALTT